MANFNAPASIAETVISKVGVSKCKLNTWNVILLGILAGAFIAFGAELATRMGAMITFDKGISTLVFGSVFSVGLMLVVIAGAELFTGNNLMVMSVLAGKAKVGQMLGKWAIVFIANFIGSMLLVWFMYASGLVSGAVADKAVAIAQAKVGLDFMPAFFRAIMCNWLVCLAVWLAIASHDITGKIFGIFFPIMAFVASGFEHSVANMYFIPIGMFLDPAHSITWGGFFHNMIPVTIGNIVGGAGFVGTIYWFVFRKCASK
ncbi:MAG: formate/nitrite transporter family protein [Candidatus Tenebribacter burtonii]|jgi:formate/nitrite transporter|nr:formate/nitrite transporter family protein [Candidatus Tenebribacter burtonii]